MGNTNAMVKTALMECEKAGCQVEFLRGDDLDIKPCTGCISCVVGMTTGRGKGGCPVKDDFPHSGRSTDGVRRCHRGLSDPTS